MPTIAVRGTELYFERAGTGEPSLLFIHGMCGGAWNWEDMLNRLSPEFTCVAYDRRGHGRSEQGTEDQSNRTHADDAAALIEVLGLDRPVLVGSSGGGGVAIEVLHRYPNIVRGAVLIEPPLFSVVPEAGHQLVGELSPVLTSAIETGGPRAAVDAFFEVVCTRFWAQINEGRKNQIRDNAPLLFQTLESGAPTITRSDLAGINCPVLVVAGEKSLPSLRSVAFALADGLPDVRFIDVEESGHVVYAEKPEEFAQVVRLFVHEIAGQRSGRRPLDSPVGSKPRRLARS